MNLLSNLKGSPSSLYSLFPAQAIAAETLYLGLYIRVKKKIGHEKAQSVIDSITSSYAAEGQANANPMLQHVAGQAGYPPIPFGFPAPGGRGMPFPPPFPPSGAPGSGDKSMPIPMPLPNMPPGSLPFPPPPPGGFPPNFQFPPPGAGGVPPLPPFPGQQGQMPGQGPSSAGGPPAPPGLGQQQAGGLPHGPQAPPGLGDSR
ncbi:diaphanous-1 [Microsporum canis CBS 113480]|uniref:Diaphanous-1 n=1 Tax=Arthroderma otae (strain ATCC MYA-4605 / CBS 113480) TaxID=554155 RepID=C5FEC8_ARTOC|nr:diaphanous-1 [Microsporum canis CBS 113480]EEQ28162.1 diaphanous-1 [Microsporum canis CBS 113480]